MKYSCLAFFLILFTFFLADFLCGQSVSKIHKGSIPFQHMLHGDSLGIDCSNCHTGARSEKNAYMPKKSDCMDCHRLPLTEKPLIQKLDSILSKTSSEPWLYESLFPEHVVFHHGIHSSAGVDCFDCHKNFEKDIYGNEKFDMNMCVSCHKRETFKNKNFKIARTDCGVCHR